MIDCSKIDSVDFTAAKSLKAMLEDFSRRKQRLVWLNMDDEVEKTVASVCKVEKIGNVQELLNA